jgi:putative transposase
MRRIDELHLKCPFYGSRKISQALRGERPDVNRKRVQRLMRLMGLEAMAPRPGTSKAHPEHTVYPYLLRNLDVCRPNQVWAADITYVPMKEGFLYLVAIMDWYSRLVLSWRLSNTMDTSFCVEALEEALTRFGAPDIFNTDQGAQFTAEAFIKPLRERGVAVSMDGKGRCIDNVFVERLWRSLKYEEVYLRVYESGPEARAAIGSLLHFLQWREAASGARLSDSGGISSTIAQGRIDTSPQRFPQVASLPPAPLVFQPESHVQH